MRKIPSTMMSLGLDSLFLVISVSAELESDKSSQTQENELLEKLMAQKGIRMSAKRSEVVFDSVFIIQYVFKGGPAPDSPQSGDTDYDGSVNVTDAVHIINYVCKGGPEPCFP